MNIYSAFKQLAFKFDPEFIHDLSIHSGHALPRVSKLFSPLKYDSNLSLEVGPLHWKFPVGLAAGFDKNAMALEFFDQLGFGAIEAGTVTKKPQIGNPKPRIFRHLELKSVRNAMGFPNQGSESILQNITNSHHQISSLGVNIGKNKDTSEADTAEEYSYLYRMFAPVSDYIVVNISSPNTPGLRSFQKQELLAPILGAIKLEREKFEKPVFIKIAPDLSDDDLKMICEQSKNFDFNGVIATNTTIQHNYGKGGVSGAYIKSISQNIRKKVCEVLKEDPNQIIIGVGGIDSYEEIKEFWKNGGSFTQVYTSFIYQGPQMLKNIADAMRQDMQKYQVQSVQELFTAIRSS